MKDLLKVGELAPKMARLLSGRPNLLEHLEAAYGDKEEYLQYLNQLVIDLDVAGVKGLSSKVAEADNLHKFLSMVAELEVARFLSNQGKEIELLADNAWLGPSPDMIVRDGEHELFAEVKLITEDAAVTKVREELDRFLLTLATPIRVDMQLKGEMVPPVTTREERQWKEEAADAAIKGFKEQIRSRDSRTLPFTIVTPHIDFYLLACSSKTGFTGVVSTGMFTVPEGAIIEKLKSDTKLKAAKRNKWTGDKRNRPFIIVLVDELAWTDRGTMTAAFVGNVTYDDFSDFSKLPIASRVESAMKEGWEEYLLEECFLPNEESRCFLPMGGEGAFLKDDAMQNVSAVLVSIITGRYYFLPNPVLSNLRDTVLPVKWRDTVLSG